ncbi:MAG: hypothetical protein HDS95_03315 [Bacteroidales bacterium]|nr:hypothetical protein [Bacteroidales bacterium]
MKTFIAASLLLAVALNPLSTDAQRRGRPGSMKHTETEVLQKQAEVRRQQEGTKISCRYICNGHIFEGPVYRTGAAGGIKIGDAAIIFSGGKYKLSFDAAKFKIKKYPVMTDAELARRGISKYEYENSWEYKELGQDFEYGGKFDTLEQGGGKWLVLYNGDTDNIFAKILISGVNADSFELDEDEMLVRMSLTK